jgi:AbiV family abortive infection protein
MINYISEPSLDEGIRLCFDKAKRLACDAELILEKRGGSSYALVLYEFAIEEYGKGELLRDCNIGGSIKKSHISFL